MTDRLDSFEGVDDSRPILGGPALGGPTGRKDALACGNVKRKGENEVMMTMLATMARDESGQDLIEYALLAGLISLVAVAAVVNVGSGVNIVWLGVDSQIGSIPTP